MEFRFYYLLFFAHTNQEAVISKLTIDCQHLILPNVLVDEFAHVVHSLVPTLTNLSDF